MKGNEGGMKDREERGSGKGEEDWVGREHGWWVKERQDG